MRKEWKYSSKKSDFMKRKLFGTDGIRGKTNAYPMTPEMALRLGKAVAKICKHNNHHARIVIGKDTRLSGYLLETSLSAGILSMGVDVYLVGPLPTPAVAHLVESLNCDAGIVLSASHNPAEDNGIKIFGSDGYKLADGKEAEIEKIIFGNIDEEYADGNEIGRAIRIDDARGRYIAFAKNIIKSRSLEGLKVVVDCANGAAYKVAPWAIKELGAEVIALNKEPNGLNINENCGALHPEVIQNAVKEHNADVGLALDGDADRLIVCDEHANIVDGDHIMAVCALDLKESGRLGKDTVVATVMSNIGFEEAMRKHNIKVVRTKVGDRYVIEEMQNNGYSFGGEQSGHIIFGNYSTTGDGLLTALYLLDVMKRKNKKLSKLASVMKSYPQTLVNVKVREKKAFEKMGKVKDKIGEIEKKLGSAGRVLVRYSGTENLARVMIEGKNQGEIEGYAQEIAEEIRKDIEV